MSMLIEILIDFG